jgi:hypothetical protein
LKKQKPQDVLTFAKQGNLAMVHGLVQHHRLQHTLLTLKGLDEEFLMKKGEKKVSMSTWNALHIAVANKKLEIVHYLQEHCGMSLAVAGGSPDGS